MCKRRAEASRSESSRPAGRMDLTEAQWAIIAYLKEATLRAVRNPGTITLARDLKTPEA